MAGATSSRCAPTRSSPGLLGLGTDTGDLDDAYLQVAPGRGITAETMQFHGRADRWTLAGATSVATLFSTATAGTANPAVTLRTVGAGQAAAFSYDLARSIVATRQGNVDWAGRDRDGIGPIRSDDLFRTDTPAGTWVDMGKIAIPQADEQQRLLANLIGEMNADRMPLPRFWYLPRGEKAAVVMTGDDHGTSGTPEFFDFFKEESDNGCSVADWECIRSTSYVYPGTFTNAEAADYQADGFEIALHLNTSCSDFTPDSLDDDFRTQLISFKSSFPGLATPRTTRTHCIVWSDWASGARMAGRNGVRLDANYYYWPAAWVLDRPGMFTGSGFPMRFADVDGSLIDVYQAATQLTDESEIDYAKHIKALLDGALGSQGYYGVFTANMHTDQSNVGDPGAPAIVAEAKRRGVPVVSAVQMLDWLDGRNGSSFGGLSFSANQLTFSITRGGAGARGLQAMLPLAGPSGALAGVTRAGSPVATTTRTVKGVDYAVFDAAAGDYTATYGAAPPQPPAAPETTITAFAQTGTSARADFTTDTAGAGFQCRLDGAAFAACANPKQYASLAAGQHTFQVRAVAASGTPDATPAERGFTVVSGTTPGNPGDGSGPEDGSGPSGADHVSPTVLIRTRRARVDATGAVSLRVSCPQGEISCVVQLRLRRKGHDIATRTVTLPGGRTRDYRLRVKRAARTKLAQKGSLRVTAVARARDAAGNEATARTAVRLLAPQGR